MFESAILVNAPCVTTRAMPRTRSSEAKAMQRGEVGYIHSYTTGSALDGPGLRFVLWTTGCPFRCQYCHNPDTMKLHNGEYRSFDDIMGEIGKYERFLRLTHGGVTISGGEPLVQKPFVQRIFRDCKRRGLHTALDTNGFLGAQLSDEDLESIDLMLLDIKSWDRATHRQVTGCDIDPVLQFARRLDALNRSTWIRFVLVPGLTDDRENIAGIADFVATLHNIERVEVLPFHQMGAYKWQQLGLGYQLADVAAPTPEAVADAVNIFRERGCNAQ